MFCFNDDLDNNNREGDDEFYFDDDLSLFFGIKINDFVWMYLKEIGCVFLLFVDDEVEFVKWIENGDEEVKC